MTDNLIHTETNVRFCSNCNRFFGYVSSRIGLLLESEYHYFNHYKFCKNYTPSFLK